MLNCEGAEAEGRVDLLHSTSLVLEVLPWADARVFHNMVMLKIEQGRISWMTDFNILSEQFLDKKVRQSLRSKAATSSGLTQRSNFNGKSVGKGFNNFNGRNFNNRNKSLYSVICKQWNSSLCTYGDRCKKWHVCWTCAEAGRPGELHKASSHEASGSSTRQPQSEQRR